MTTPAALRRLSDRITTTARPPQQATWRRGTIASINGTLADGTGDVTVAIGGDTLPAPYLMPAAFGVGDPVWVQITDSSPLIMGRIGGPPTA